MENFEHAKKVASHELPEHSGINGPELQLPTPTPEIDREKKISPEQLNDLIQKLPEDPADDPQEPKTPTIH